LFEASSFPSDTAVGRVLPRVARWTWPIVVAIFFLATILKSGQLSDLLPAMVWNAVQFGPVLVATVVLFLGRVGQSLPARQTRVLWALALFSVAATLSLITSSAVTTTLAQLAILLIMFSFLAVTYRYRWNSARRVNGDLTWVFVLIGANQAVGLVGAMFNSPWAIGDFYRLTGTTNNANYAGILSAIGLTIGVHLFLRADVRTRIMLGALGAIDLSTLIWSGSRGAMLAVIVGCIVLLVIKRKWRVLIASAVAFAVAVGAVFALLPNLLNRVSLNDLDSGRFELYLTVLDHWLDQPILGIGYRTTQALEGTQGFEAHNIYLSVLAETGAIGFLAFLMLLVSIFLAGRSSSAIVGAAAIAVNEFSESSLFGWGGPTALFAWVVLLAYAALGRFHRETEARGVDSAKGDEALIENPI
jgi:O-antigen ligase